MKTRVLTWLLVAAALLMLEGKAFAQTVPPNRFGGTVTIGEGTYSYGVGQLVTIVGEANPGSRFVGWIVESGSASFSDANAEHTTFTMGSTATTIRAKFVPTLLPALSMHSRLLLAALLIGTTFLMVRRQVG